MTDIMLHLERPARGASRPLLSEREMLDSVAKVLTEARANGVELNLTGERLPAAALRELRQRLARSAWEAGALTGERPLHTEQGWEPPGEARKLPWQEVAIDALGFLASAMAPADLSIWEEKAP